MKETLLLYRGRRGYCFFCLLAALMTTLMLYIEPMIYQKLIDDVMTEGRIAELGYILAAYLAVFLLTTLFDYLKRYSAYRIRVEGTVVLKKKLLGNFFAGPIRDINRKSISEQNEMIESDASFAGSFYEEVFVGGLISLLKIIAAFIFCLTLSAELSALVVWIIPLTILVDSLIARKEKTVLEENRKNET